MEKTAGRLMRSAGAATASQVWRIGVTFATHLALRRMVPPEEYGIWVWAEPLFLVLAQLRDVGVPGHIVRDRSRPYGNYLGLQVTWGGMVALALLVGAPIVTLLYADRNAEVVQVVRAMCFFLFVQGLASVPLTYFEAELEVGKTVPAEIARNLVFALLSLTLARLGHGVWSLVIAHIAGGTVYAALLWWKAWGRMELHWVPGGMRRLVLLSYPLALLSALEQLVLRIDALVLGVRFPTEVVGTAGLAIFAVFFFSRFLAEPVGRALYPALVHYGNDPPRAFEAFRLATLTMLTCVVPTAFFLLLNAPLVVAFLGGEKWTGAVTYLRVLSLVPLARPLAMFGLEFLLTRHRDRLLIGYTLLNFVSLAGLGLFLTATSLRELGMAVASYLPLGGVLLAWGLHEISPQGFRGLMRDVALTYAAASVVFLPILLVPGDQRWLRLALSAIAGLLLLAFMVWRHGAAVRGFLAEKEGSDVP